jgi:hypothetical protein
MPSRKLSDCRQRPAFWCRKVHAPSKTGHEQRRPNTIFYKKLHQTTEIIIHGRAVKGSMS